MILLLKVIEGVYSYNIVLFVIWNFIINKLKFCSITYVTTQRSPIYVKVNFNMYREKYFFEALKTGGYNIYTILIKF